MINTTKKGAGAVLYGSLRLHTKNTYTGGVGAEPAYWRTSWTAQRADAGEVQVGKSPTATPRRAELPVA